MRLITAISPLTGIVIRAPPVNRRRMLWVFAFTGAHDPHRHAYVLMPPKCARSLRVVPSLFQKTSSRELAKGTGLITPQSAMEKRGGLDPAIVMNWEGRCSVRRPASQTIHLRNALSKGFTRHPSVRRRRKHSWTVSRTHGEDSLSPGPWHSRCRAFFPSASSIRRIARRAR
jgi:hypothetical protein